MKNHHNLLVIVLVLVLAACSPSTEPNITIDNAWVRATTLTNMDSQSQSDGMQDMAGPNSAAYMRIRNSGRSADRLVRAESDIAHSVEIHLSELKDGVMSMHPVEALDIQPDSEVELKPGSYHVMLVNITRDLIAGDTVLLTLDFEKSGKITVEAEVRAP